MLAGQGGAWSTEVDLLVSESDRCDDLIAMKKQAGRPQDLLDVAELEDIRTRLG